ncbi:MAG: class I SAM-dependent methyltransferase [Chloroflexota bacterium]
MEWDPETYLAEMLDEIPGYVELQETVVAAIDMPPSTILELGTGTGETATRILAAYPDAHWTGVDSSEPMLARARERLPHADLRVQRLEDPLPEGPFDLVVSVLAVHHLDAGAKRDLFHRLATLTDRFILGDVVVPTNPAEAVIEIDGVYDVPSTTAEQEAWLEEAGFDVEVTPVRTDLTVFRCRKRR